MSSICCIFEIKNINIMEHITRLFLLLIVSMAFSCKGSDENPAPSDNEPEPFPNDIELTTDNVLNHLGEKEFVIVANRENQEFECAWEIAYRFRLENKYGDIIMHIVWHTDSMAVRVDKFAASIVNNSLVIDTKTNNNYVYFSYDTNTRALKFISSELLIEATNEGLDQDIYKYRPTLEEFRSLSGKYNVVFKEMFHQEEIHQELTAYIVDELDGIKGKSLIFDTDQFETLSETRMIISYHDLFRDSANTLTIQQCTNRYITTIDSEGVISISRVLQGWWGDEEVFLEEYFVATPKNKD